MNKSDAAARKRLFAELYEKLHRRASRMLKANVDISLNTTGLVHEAYLRIDKAEYVDLDRAHIFHLAATAMHQIIVDQARYQNAQKRDRNLVVTIDDALVEDSAHAIDVLALDKALSRLAAKNEQLADLVKLHFFAGCKFEEIAELHETSVATVHREWRKARAALYRYLEDSEP